MNSNQSGGRCRNRRTLTKLSTLSVAAIAAGALAAPAANAAVDPGRNVGTFHNIDFVAGFGWDVGPQLTVEAFRNGQLIGSAAGPTIAVDEGLAKQGALEVNHGPEGAPQPGDCWTGYTPDIQPGDEVRLTQGTSSDSVIINPITVDEGPFLNGDGNVEVRGRASFSDGTPITIPFLDSGGVLNTSKFRGGPNEQFRTPGTTDGWTMIFDPASPMDASRDGREPAGLSTADRQALLMSGEYGMGYGHVAPLPPETQLFEGNADAPGPALGCEASPSESNGVSSTDTPSINLTSGDLVVTGKAMAGTFDNDITSVVPKLSAGTTTIPGTPVDVTGAVRDWTATFTRAQLLTLADGPVTISADYVTVEGAIGGHTKTLQKDTIAPAVTADPAPGTYVGARSVSLSAGPGESIRYSTDGGSATRAYGGPIALGVGSTTIHTTVTDAAGNTTATPFSYVIAAPAAGPVAQAIKVLAPASNRRSLNLSRSSYRLARSVRLRSARRNGVLVRYRAPAGAKRMQFAVYRSSGASARRALVKRTVRVRPGQRSIRLKWRGMRAGRYVLRIRALRNGQAGRVSRRSFKITR